MDLSFSCGVLAVSLVLLLLLSGDIETNPGPTIIPRSFLSELAKLPMTAKWRELGIQLGLPKYRLDGIQANHHNHPSFSQLCLIDMFESWLNYTVASETTFDVLAKALHTQGHEVFDAGKETLCPAYASSQPFEKNIKFSVAHKWKDICQELGVPNNVLDTIKQDHGHQKHLSSEVNPDQWCFLKSLEWWKENAPTEDINLQEFLKALHGVGKHDLEKEMKQIHYGNFEPRLELPECIVRYSEYLREMYLDQPVLPDSDWPPSLGGQFIRLALIPRERGVYAEKYDAIVKEQRDYVRGNVDKILAGRNDEKTETQVEQIFKSQHCLAGEKFSLRILIDGAPGVGKTTLSRKFTQDWASGKLLQEYDLVILLHLRDRAVSQATSINEFFYHDDPDLHQSVVRHVRKTSGKRVMLIFDGFDELSAVERSRGSFFMNIIEGKVLKKCSVVVTSRPYASVGLQELSSINRHIEVLGFTEEMIKQCIVKTIKDNPEKAEELCIQLHERLDIMSLCYIPLNCAIILFVYQQENFILPKTLTELYDIFALHTIKRHTRNLLGDTAARRIRCLDRLPKEVQPQFLMLSKLAYNSLIKDQLVFHEEDILESFPDIGDQDIERQTLALMTVAKSYSKRGRVVTCNFLHLTIQEFLAAKWAVANLSSTEISNFLKQNLKNDRLRMTLLFVAGIAKDDFPNLDIEFIDNKSSLTTCPPNHTFLLLCHLAYESESRTVSMHLLTNSVKMMNKLAIELSYQKLSEFELLVVLTFILRSESQWDLLKFKCKQQQLKMYREVCSNAVFIKEIDLEFDGKNYAELKKYLEEASEFSDLKLHVTNSFDDSDSITTLLSLSSIPNLSVLSFLSVVYTCTQVIGNDLHPKRTLNISLSCDQLTSFQFSTILGFFLQSSYHWDLLTLRFFEPEVSFENVKSKSDWNTSLNVHEIELYYGDGTNCASLHSILEQLCKPLNAKVRVICTDKKLGYSELLSEIIHLEIPNLSLTFSFYSIVYTVETIESQQFREIVVQDYKNHDLSRTCGSVILVILKSGISWDILKLHCSQHSLHYASQKLNENRVLKLQIKDMYLEYDSDNLSLLKEFLQVHMVPSVQNIEVKTTAPHLVIPSKSMSLLPTITMTVKNISKLSSFSITSQGTATCSSTDCECHRIIDAMYCNTNIQELHVMFHRSCLDSLTNLLQKNKFLIILEIFVIPSHESDLIDIKKLIKTLKKPLTVNKTLNKFTITYTSGSHSFKRDPVTSKFNLAISQGGDNYSKIDGTTSSQASNSNCSIQ